MIRKWLGLPAVYRAPEEGGPSETGSGKPNRVIQELEDTGRIPDSASWEERLLGAAVK